MGSKGIKYINIMKLFIFIVLIFHPFFPSEIYGQKCINDIFEIEYRTKNYDEIQVNYYDKSKKEFSYSPEFSSKVPMDRLISFEFNSIQKKDSIEQLLFNTQELDTLKRGFAICMIHIPSGKIMSISFSLQNKVDIIKLNKLKDEFEQNLHYDIVLNAKLEKEGYWGKSFPIFVSRRRE